ncbi:helix-turn-helix domain-containing protein [Candidatus Enterovibrio escicola]|uniref:helix-turn-helix domain-containing protein n=1 Tax=Candidatus Enterovibrio escicola TaxID=1927127 RepID=UPI0011BA75C8|nr:helix-turn-helix domain-containing protein [Candidatus Enterovibrio escacola]
MAKGNSFSQISLTLGCVHSTISREIKRHLPNNFTTYIDIISHQNRLNKPASMLRTGWLFAIFKRKNKFINEYFNTYTSPDAISGELDLKHDGMLS